MPIRERNENYSIELRKEIMLYFDKPLYLSWLKTKEIIFDHEHKICCFELAYDINDSEILNDWAKHIRRHYISDDELDNELEFTGMNRYEYLSKNIIPDKLIRLGATMISGEFAEILTYDIREYIFGEQALRGRHTFKATPEQGVTGSDILTYKLISGSISDINDTLFITESKAVLSQTDYTVITKAYTDSSKDTFRYSVSLNYLARLYYASGDTVKRNVVRRFVNKLEKDYSQEYEGSATTSVNLYDESRVIQEYNNGAQFNRTIFVYGKNLLELAKNLYERACYV